MKELLENFFGPYYKSTKKVVVDSEHKIGRFGLYDAKACGDCRLKSPEFESDCNHTVLICHSDKSVEVISLEKFLEEYNNLKAMPSHSKCDIMIVCENSIVLCDLSCSNPKYIGMFNNSSGDEKLGKRITARHQIENTITLLMNVTQIADEILSKATKIALFAYREKSRGNLSEFDGKVASNMLAFNRIENKLSTSGLKSESVHGFVFSEIKYPEVFYM